MATTATQSAAAFSSAAGAGNGTPVTAGVVRDNFRPNIPDLDPERVKVIEQYGGTIKPLNPIGAAVYGIDLKGPRPPEDVLKALEHEMATRGFLSFKNQDPELSVDQSLECSKWWGAHEIHSTHGVHPATPQQNRHIFRLSNDRQHGILGVGPQWHNDGSFEDRVFSHVTYQIKRVAENGGGTYFCHQGAAFDALPPERQEFWQRLSSVNSNSGVVHPAVHTHRISGRKSIWLHLGMTGAVIENFPEQEGFRLLNEQEMRRLFHEYNDVLNAGFEYGYANPYEYETGDCIFIDNMAVAHRASPDAHKPPSEQGLRILHRITIKAPEVFAPDHNLPQFVNIHGPNPSQDGVWIGGGIGFRWDDDIPMQN